MKQLFSINNIAIINKFLLSILLFIVIFFIIAARRSDILLHAQPWAEDGRMWMAGIYNDGWKTLLIPQNGYYQTISRLALGIGLLFGMSKAALIANMIAIAIRCCFVMFVLSSRISFIPIVYRIAAVTYFIFMPNLAEGYVNITNAQWYLALYLFVIVFADNPETRLWKFHDLTVGFLAALSGPFVIFIVPCLAIKRVMQSGSISKAVKAISLFDIIMIGCCVVQVLSIVLTTNPDTRSPAPLGAHFQLLVDIISCRIVGGSFFSNYIIMHFGPIWWLDIIIFIIMLLTFLICFIYHGWRMRICIVFPLLLIIFALAKPMINMMEPQWPFFLELGVAERYFFIPNFAFFCFVLFIISRMGRFSHTILYCLMICMVPSFFECFSIPPLDRSSYKEDVAKFGTLAKGQEVVIHFPPGWDAVFKKK